MVVVDPGLFRSIGQRRSHSKRDACPLAKRARLSQTIPRLRSGAAAFFFLSLLRNRPPALHHRHLLPDAALFREHQVDASSNGEAGRLSGRPLDATLKRRRWMDTEETGSAKSYDGHGESEWVSLLSVGNSVSTVYCLLYKSRVKQHRSRPRQQQQSRVRSPHGSRDAPAGGEPTRICVHCNFD